MATNLPQKLLSERIERFIETQPFDYESDRGSSSFWYDQIQEMMLVDTVCQMAFEARALAGYFMLGAFEHESELIQAEINSDIANMPGAWVQSFLDMQSYLIYGHSFTPFAFEVEGRAVLKGLETLPHDLITYEGTRSQVVRVRYEGDEKDILIPFEWGIHLINQPSLKLKNPYGVSSARRAFPWWELENIALGAIAIATQRQATSMLVGKTDTSARVEIVDHLGRPLVDGNQQPVTRYSREVMLETLMASSNSSVAVIDRLDEILAIDHRINFEFFGDLLYECRLRRLEAFLVMPTLVGFSRSGVGDSNLAATHLTTFNRSVGANMLIFGENLIEQMIKQWIRFNHGPQDSYGRFPVNDKDPMALQLLDTISNAVQKGAFTAEDQNIVLKAKELAGVKV